MTLELTEENWMVELAELAREGRISKITQSQLTELIHTGGKRGILMSPEAFTRLTAEVFTIKFPATRKKFILVHKADRALFTPTEW